MTTGDLQDEGSTTARTDEGPESEAWEPAERELLAAAIDFFGAAEGVIDFAGLERPQVRRDAAGFDAVRRTMGVLEVRVRNAHAAGLPPTRIAEIARIEQEIVELILQRQPDAAPGPGQA